jgi:hypothetical protein
MYFAWLFVLSKVVPKENWGILLGKSKKYDFLFLVGDNLSM